MTDLERQEFQDWLDFQTSVYNPLYFGPYY